jgi:hypothetical protein
MTVVVRRPAPPLDGLVTAITYTVARINRIWLTSSVSWWA